ncbi:MAG: histidine--tRNA ligase [Gemmatimonadaceae bacterium]|nr:histidine--tRNA ligase [Gemmatimonadaceae bacterium]
MPPKPLPGFRDFYPEQFAERAHIFETWRRVVRRYAFQEYDGPPLEALDLYTQKSGDEIVTQLYNFVDKGDRAVALRPEMTPTFARMVGARAQALRKPVRWFSIPQLFRYERTQKGRLREHFQLNVDIVGEGDVLADAELLSIAIEIMRAFGLASTDVRARVSDRRLLNALLTHLGIAEPSWTVVYAVLDKLDRQPREVSAEKLLAAGLAAETCRAVLGFGTLDFETMRDTYGASPIVAPHVEHFAEYLAHAEALGVAEWIRFDLTIVRGLAYYTGIVFELFDAVGEFRAICGGGRYDGLLASVGGVDLPALGFGLGDVVLGELLRARGLMTTRDESREYCWVIQEPGEPSYPRAMLTAASRLRAEDFRVEYALRRQRGDRQREVAKKAGARFTVEVSHSDDDAIRVSVMERGQEPKGFENLEDAIQVLKQLSGRRDE